MPSSSKQLQVMYWQTLTHRKRIAQRHRCSFRLIRNTAGRRNEPDECSRLSPGETCSPLPETFATWGWARCIGGEIRTEKTTSRMFSAPHAHVPSCGVFHRKRPSIRQQPARRQAWEAKEAAALFPWLGRLETRGETSVNTSRSRQPMRQGQRSTIQTELTKQASRDPDAHAPMCSDGAKSPCKANPAAGEGWTDPLVYFGKAKSTRASMAQKRLWYSDRLWEFGAACYSFRKMLTKTEEGK